MVVPPDILTKAIDIGMGGASSKALDSFLNPLVSHFIEFVSEVVAKHDIFEQLHSNDFDESTFSKLMRRALTEETSSVPRKLKMAFKRWAPKLQLQRSQIFDLALSVAETDAEIEDYARRNLEARANAKAWDEVLHRVDEDLGRGTVAKRLIQRLDGSEKWCDRTVLIELALRLRSHSRGCSVFSEVIARLKEIAVADPTLLSETSLKPLLKVIAPRQSKPRKPAKRKNNSRQISFPEAKK
jgi:hypothetical protein